MNIKNNKKQGFFFALLLAVSAITFGVKEINSKDQKYLELKAATAISEYYKTVNGTGASLLNSVSARINNGAQDLGYAGVWELYKTADIRDDGKIYDLYSNKTNFNPGKGQCGSYSSIGSCYNREHTIPKSWWGGQTSKQGSDGFIVLPSDGKINGARSNFPYGETSKGTTYSLEGDPAGNRLGESTSTQYVTGTVFEPFDDRKGDLARVYFYAATRYKDSGAGNGKFSSWTSGNGGSVIGEGGNYKFGFKKSYLDMLLKWHNDDPVSDWEIKRNNLVENKQGNRNPFVDHPSWVDLIWGGTYASTNKNAENTKNGTASVSGGSLGGYIDDNGTDSIGLSVNPTSITLKNIDDTATISATLVGATGTITWYTYSSTGEEIVSLSKTTGNSITITAVNEGTASVFANFGNYSAECEVTVGEESSGPIAGSLESLTNSHFTSSYPKNEDMFTTDEGITFRYKSIMNYQSSIQFKSGEGYIYNSEPLTKLKSIELATKSNKTFSGLLYFGETSNPSTNQTVVSNGNTYNAPEGCEYFKLKVGNSAGNLASINFAYDIVKTLTSIELSGQTTVFVQNSTFSFDGTVTAKYNDKTSKSIDSNKCVISNPDLSSEGEDEVTVSYTENKVTKSSTYTIQIVTQGVMNISATTSKSFKVGETITKSDITLVANYYNGSNDISDFEFEDYMFTYEDAPSGGEVGHKIFTITYDDKETELSVDVSREAYVGTSSNSLTLNDSMFSLVGGSNNNLVSKTITYGGVNYKVYNGYYYTNGHKLSFGDGESFENGYFMNDTPFSQPISTITVTEDNYTGNLYLSADKDTWVRYADRSDDGSYYYFKIDYKNISITNKKYINISSIVVSFKGYESLLDVCNYIMYEDTNGQCLTKLDIAIGKLNNMSNSDMGTFVNSNNYVIEQARTRVEAWARNQGKTFSFDSTNNTFSYSSNLTNEAKSNYSSLILIISVITISSIAFGLIILNKKKRYDDK